MGTRLDQPLRRVSGFAMNVTGVVGIPFAFVPGTTNSSNEPDAFVTWHRRPEPQTRPNSCTMEWNKRRWATIVMALCVLSLYAGSVYRNATEGRRRSLELTEGSTDENRVLVIVRVTGVNPAQRQLIAQVSFRLFGDLQQDSMTPKVNLKLLVNNITGQQEFDFSRGERMSRIEVTFPMDGEVNKYPLDRYTSPWRFLITKPGGSRTAAVSRSGTAASTGTDELAVGESVFNGRIAVPISVSTIASVQGIKFSRGVSPSSEPDTAKVDLNIERPRNLVVVSFFVMVLMMTLALTVLIMALKATVAGKSFDLLPLSLSLTLIFGLPALRNIQPGVPPVGALADYVSFIWAECFVAASAIIVMLTWLLRGNSKSS